MILKDFEAVALAAVLQHVRDAGSLPLRRPSYQQPTFYSRPINETRMPLVPPGGGWTTVLEWEAPKQYISVITSYVATVAESLAAPDCSFRIFVNGAIPSGISIAAGANLFYTGAMPLVPRAMHLAVNELNLFQLQMLNNTLFPRTAMCAVYGWSYPATDIEFGSGAAEGINDA